MMWHLAGAQGEFLGGAVGRFDESLDELDRREALAISRRSPRHREVRAELDEKDPKGNPDQYQSEALSAALTADPGEPDLVTAAHMAWIGSEARRLLERHVGALAALADALFAAIEMTGPEIEAVIHAHPCECHHWPEVTP
jgi:DNA-binding SARP family transcriptional activator